MCIENQAIPPSSQDNPVGWLSRISAISLRSALSVLDIAGNRPVHCRFCGQSDRSKEYNMKTFILASVGLVWFWFVVTVLFSL